MYLPPRFGEWKRPADSQRESALDLIALVGSNLKLIVGLKTCQKIETQQPETATPGVNPAREEKTMYSKNNISTSTSQANQASVDYLTTTHIHNDFGELRAITDENGNPWFVGKDVALVLGYANTNDAISKHCKGVANHYPLSTPGGMQNVRIISEPDLYRLIAKSELPAAERFEVWIFDEVLPTIRKHGMYATQDFVESALADPDTMIRTLQALKDERVKCQALKAENKEMQPKALFADAVSASTSSILVGELAKIMRQNGIQTGQNRFFAWLRDNGYLIKRKGTDFNMPTQKSMELGLFEIKERTIVNPDESTRITKTSKVTGKGQQYFINVFMSRNTDALPVI